MRIKKIGYAMMALLATGFGSCDQVETKTLEQSAQLNVIPVVEGQAATKATLKTAWVSNDVIGWYLTESGKSTYVGQTYANKKLTYNSTTWALEVTPGMTKTVGTIYAYYPYLAGTTSINALAVDNSKDYLYGSVGSLSAANTTANLTMKHANCQIAIKIVKGSYGYASSVSDVKVKSANVGTSGTIDVATGNVTVTAAGTNKDITLDGGTKTITAEGVEWSNIFVQGTTSSVPTATVVLDGQTYIVALPSFTPVQGKKHIFTITANSANLTVSETVTIIPWEDKIEGSGEIL